MSVIIKIMGGLASQMHKYAIGRAIADKCNSELMLDLSWFNGEIDSDTKREFQLDKFEARYSIASRKAVGQLKSSYLRRKLALMARKVGSKNNFLKDSHYVKGVDSRNVLSITSPIYIEGEWFGAIYIDAIRNDLIKDFSLKAPLRESPRVLLQSILNTESIAIHVRRGDYISNPFASKFHYLTGVEYFKAAVDKCISAFKNPVFFVFSDDPVWVVDAFSSMQGEFIHVRNNEPFEDLELIKNCKHQIICNSGFGWFGAWLNNSESKLNIAPKLWVKDPVLNHQITSDLCRSDMLLI